MTPGRELRRFIEERNGTGLRPGEVRRLNKLIDRIYSEPHIHGLRSKPEFPALVWEETTKKYESESYTLTIGYTKLDIFRPWEKKRWSLRVTNAHHDAMRFWEELNTSDLGTAKERALKIVRERLVDQQQATSQFIEQIDDALYARKPWKD